VDLIISILWNIIALPTAFFIGRFTERRHVRRLDERERAAGNVLVTNLKRVQDPGSVEAGRMVIGHVVIATDYWKSFATRLRKLIGGEMKSAQSLMIRGRREALMRLVENARAMGAAEVCNVRYEFSNIGMMRGRGGGPMQVEILAYGTAIVRRAGRVPAP
jgi:uncharacterized protein YbjQ (UPF0145 family)